MKNKLIWACVGCLMTILSLMVARGQTSQPAGAPAVGRFQLFQGQLSVSLNGSTIRDIAVLRIDTQTGQVSRYFAGMKDGRTVDYWVPIQEPAR